MRYAITIAVLLSVPLLAQNPVEERFEVVSIKPHTGGPTTSVPPPSPGALRRPNVTVQALVLFAYGIEGYQVIDMPAWGRTDRFDVEARAAGATLAVMPAMTRSLLRDRFGLRTHQETREGTTYSLGLSQTNGQLGPGIRRNSDECKSTIAPPRSVPAGAITATGCGSVDQIARFAARMLGAPVTDKTRLSGVWEYALFYSPDGTPFGSVSDTPDTFAPHLTTALQEQLGLKVESSRGSIEVLVIDRIERPSEN